MKATFKIVAQLPLVKGTSLRGDYEYIDAVGRKDETVKYANGDESTVTELMALRMRGTVAEAWNREVKTGDKVEVTFRPNCSENTSKKSGNLYYANDMVFAVSEFNVV